MTSTTCLDCGAPFVRPEDVGVRLDGTPLAPPKRCPVCRVERRRLVEATCAKCGTTFVDSVAHLRYVAGRGLAPRCSPCRPAPRA